MKFGIFSDVHGNLQALNAVLDHMSSFKLDKTICLGDVVNYGANSKECLELVLKETDHLIRGNHEQAMLDQDYSRFSTQRGKDALDETIKSIPSTLRHKVGLYFEDFKLFMVDGLTIMMCHSSKEDFWKNPLDDDLSYEYDYVISGHTHFPLIQGRKKNGKVTKFLNPGSVGQPRDQNPRASWMLFDTETGSVQIHRVEYDVEEAQRLILEKTRVHHYYADRLAKGN